MVAVVSEAPAASVASPPSVASLAKAAAAAPAPGSCCCCSFSFLRRALRAAFELQMSHCVLFPICVIFRIVRFDCWIVGLFYCRIVVGCRVGCSVEMFWIL